MSPPDGRVDARPTVFRRPTNRRAVIELKRRSRRNRERRVAEVLDAYRIHGTFVMLTGLRTLRIIDLSPDAGRVGVA